MRTRSAKALQHEIMTFATVGDRAAADRAAASAPVDSTTAPSAAPAPQNTATSEKKTVSLAQFLDGPEFTALLEETNRPTAKRTIGILITIISTAYVVKYMDINANFLAALWFYVNTFKLVGDYVIPRAAIPFHYLRFVFIVWCLMLPVIQTCMIAAAPFVAIFSPADIRIVLAVVTAWKISIFFTTKKPEPVVSK